MRGELRGGGGIPEEEKESSEVIIDNQARENEVAPEIGQLYAG